MVQKHQLVRPAETCLAVSKHSLGQASPRSWVIVPERGTGAQPLLTLLHVTGWIWPQLCRNTQPPAEYSHPDSPDPAWDTPRFSQHRSLVAAAWTPWVLNWRSSACQAQPPASKGGGRCFVSRGARAGSGESLDKCTGHALRRKTALKISEATTSFHWAFVKNAWLC